MMVFEENVLTVADAVEEEVLVVRAEDFNIPTEKVGPSFRHLEKVGPSTNKSEQLPVYPEKEKKEQGNANNWLQTQKAEDFPPFL